MRYANIISAGRYVPEIEVTNDMLRERVQQKICGIVPNSRFDLIRDSGHVVYLGKPEVFFGNLKKFAQAKSLRF